MPRRPIFRRVAVAPAPSISASSPSTDQTASAIGPGHWDSWSNGLGFGRVVLNRIARSRVVVRVSEAPHDMPLATLVDHLRQSAACARVVDEIGHLPSRESRVDRKTAAHRVGPETCESTQPGTPLERSQVTDVTLSQLGDDSRKMSPLMGESLERLLLCGRCGEQDPGKDEELHAGRSATAVPTETAGASGCFGTERKPALPIGNRAAQIKPAPPGDGDAEIDPERVGKKSNSGKQALPGSAPAF